MTQYLPFGQKFLAATIACAATMVLASAPAGAAKGPYYVAKLATPVEEAQTEIIRGIVWQCAGDTCRARKANSRPSSICARLVQEFGAVEIFMVRGEEMDSEELNECNAKA